MKTALLLIDIQNDYFPGGAMELVGMEAAAANAAELLAQARGTGALVVHVQHLSERAGSTFFLPGTPGAAISATVAPAPGEVVVVKHFPNSFRGTALLETLRAAQVTDALVCGAMTHMCVDATVRAAFDLGFGCSVAADACATRDLVFAKRQVAAADVHAAFLAALAAVYAKVAPTAEFLRE